MKRYRTSGLRLSILLLFGTIISIYLAIGKTNGIKVFLGVEAIFVAMALAAWAYTEIRFEGDDIIRTTFFLFTRKRPISAIKRIRFSTDTDSFGGRTTYTTIEFKDAKPFMLFDFAKADLHEIIDRISSVTANVVDPTVSKHLNKGADNKNRKSALRPGDRFIFTAGAIFVLLAVLWWLLQMF